MLRTEDTYPPDATLREGLARYLGENGFSQSTYTERWASLPLPFGLHMKIPSPPSRGNALRMHDLHHVLTGYGTDLAGEAEISAWEVRGGLRGTGLYVGTIISSALLQGFVSAPVRTVQAGRRAQKQRTLFNRRTEYEALLDRKIGDVRIELGIPLEGATLERGLHLDAPRAATAAE